MPPALAGLRGAAVGGSAPSGAGQLGVGRDRGLNVHAQSDKRQRNLIRRDGAVQSVKDGEGASQDKHHCRCHRVARSSIPELEAAMRSSGFEGVPEMDHGQVFGLRLLLSRREQLHVKVMPDGLIEAEIEPPPAYPLAHINPRHSYSAHGQVARLLRRWGMRFKTAQAVPRTCLEPAIDKPDNPSHWSAIALGIGVGVGAGIVAWLLGKALDERRS